VLYRIGKGYEDMEKGGGKPKEDSGFGVSGRGKKKRIGREFSC